MMWLVSFAWPLYMAIWDGSSSAVHEPVIIYIMHSEHVIKRTICYIYNMGDQ